MKKFLLSLCCLVGLTAYADITETFKYTDSWLPDLTTVQSCTDYTTTATSTNTNIEYTLTASYCNSGYDYLMFGSKKLKTEASLSFALPETVTAIEFTTGANASASAVYSVVAGETTIDAGTKWGKGATVSVDIPADCQAAGTIITVACTNTSYNGQIASMTLVTVSAVEAPTFSVEEGTYSEAQTVELSAAEGCTIYYTTDGVTPTDDTADGSTIKYESPITVSETTTIKAIAVDGDDNFSNVASATYKIVELLEGATGSGTEADPYNTIAAYNEAIMGSTAEVYVKGIIVSVASIDTGDYGNANYYISADGTETNQFYIYRGYGLGGVKFTAEDDIKAGDEVVVCGKLTTYNEVPQIGSGSKIVELNGEVPGDGHLEGATGDGTEANPYNAAGAYNAALDGSTDNVYVLGTVVSATVSVDYGNANYYISDDGTTTNQFYIFRGLGVNGEAFTAETDLQAGDKVVVYGALTTYNGIPQLAQGSKIISHTTGIGEIEADDNNAPVEYYNLQGVRVANPENGLYIMRQGDKVVKVIK